jgi:hypothetical protein
MTVGDIVQTVAHKWIVVAPMHCPNNVETTKALSAAGKPITCPRAGRIQGQ